MDLMFKEVNYDLLNLSKLVFKKGITGTIILGNKLAKVFTALPEHYTMTDYDIHIADSSETFQVKQQMQQMSMELIKANAAGPELLINMMTAKNLTELRDCIKQSVKETKEENNQIGQLQQQLQQMMDAQKQYEQQVKELQQQNEKLQKEADKNNADKLELERRKLEIEQQKANDTKNYNDKIAAAKERQVDLEFYQLHDGNPYNDKIRDI